MLLTSLTFILYHTKWFLSWMDELIELSLPLSLCTLHFPFPKSIPGLMFLFSSVYFLDKDSDRPISVGFIRGSSFSI